VSTALRVILARADLIDPSRKRPQDLSMPKEKKAAGEKPERKTRSSGGGGRKKLTAYNKFMQTEMARLKEDEPEMSHQARFKLATSNWKASSQNPKAVAT